jgi:diguanylate cyclase (GGDEF)-like protein
MWILALLFLLVHGLVSACLPERLAPLSTLCIILAEVAALVAALRAARKVEARVRVLWWLLAVSVVFHSTAMSLDMISEATGVPVLNYVPGLSIFFSMICGVPLLATVSMSFDKRILRISRATNALLCLAIGTLLYIQIFSLLTFRGSANPADAVLILRLFDGIDVFLAVAATIRWCGADHVSERNFFRVLTIFLSLDAAFVAIHNRLLIRFDFVWLDLLISAPYVVLTVLIVAMRRDAARPASAHIALVVQSGSAMFLSIALLVIGVITSRTHFYLGLAASLLSIAGYGVLSTLAQSRVRMAEESLMTSNETLEGLVGVDGMTGIPNRWAFDETLDRECANARLTKRPVSLLMIDVDKFKQLNDLKGHQVGDHCLIQIAGALRTALPRMTDFVFRYGGEEFSAILPATGALGAEEAARKICRAVAALHLSHPASPYGVVTVSVGISTHDGVMSQSAASLVRAADKALYEAKHGGRNRFEFFSMDAIEI